MKNIKNPKMKYVKWLPMKWAVGMALPPIGIFIKNSHKDNETIHKHELIHWEQYKERGFLRFYLEYFFLWVCAGFSYSNHPWEIEARQKSQEDSSKES
jgi:hypothetical protein